MAACVRWIEQAEHKLALAITNDSFVRLSKEDQDKLITMRLALGPILNRAMD